MVPSIIFVWNILKDNNAGGGRRDALPGPYVLVLAPTRELAQQIESETRKILPTVAEANAGGNRQQHQQLIQCSCIFGGAPKGQQINELRAGVHILIATPGRLIDFLHIQKVNLSNTLFFILDEADRMLDMGFEPQVKEIHSHLIQGGEGEAKSYDNKKNLLSLMFSATWPKEIQNMAKYFLKRDFLRVNIGSTELLANKDVKQSFIHVQQENYKLDELKRILLEKKQEINKHNLADGRILIFVKTKKTADFLEFQLKKLSYDCMAIHGDKEQRQREYIMDCFKRGTVDEKKGSSSTAGSNVQKKNHMILVATDVAARGLDIKKLKLVINYDFPMQIDDYVHRIGRTGRAGEKGESITFITKKRIASLPILTTLPTC
ncbi:ATP-dependent RNA helicase DDX5/DBP2 [Angomonas deanei]|uniref:RNA helicase n=1 Tax=Angomonas deanei TaxID=59799 RepID=A0A7G2C427_9TRYP|nr:ATP-dependent RNA helicase DDX5/DBP2 [Angomonas deanei]CAD2214349.1 DEAD/DEAH box helicase/Helicase conserved C-terminal domain containing protein, putative [Angomonas deanei]|eukprot:EPY24209.1 ATP-dependent RNA helicase DDX5/DBP2 [Angomonas deanei]